MRIDASKRGPNEAPIFVSQVQNKDRVHGNIFRMFNHRRAAEVP